MIVEDWDIGAIAFMVAWKWCGEQDIFDWVSQIVASTLEKKMTQLEDPGKLVIIGYTSISQNSDWTTLLYNWLANEPFWSGTG